MAPHSSILAWEIPWTEEPGRLHSMGSQKVRHDRRTDHPPGQLLIPWSLGQFNLKIKLFTC